MKRMACLIIALTLLSAGVVYGATRGLIIITKSGQKVGGYSESHALLIGASNYQAGWPNLEGIPGELAGIERALKEHGFSVTRVNDPDSKELDQAFEDFIDEYGYDSDNRLFFYFAGHGYSLHNGDKGYLVPVDAPNPNEDMKNFIRKSLDMTQVLAWSRQMTAKHALFLFDSCFSGTILKTRALPDNPPHISAITAKPVRQYITAGSAGEVVPAKSVFAPSFIRAIRGDADMTGDGYITGTELGLFLRERVMAYGTGQTPQYGKINDPNLDEGDFVFRAGGPGHASRISQPAPLVNSEITKPQPKPGKLYVQPSPADATISILNITPRYTHGMSLMPGKYHLEVTKPGFDSVNTWVELNAGQTLNVPVKLEKQIVHNFPVTPIPASPSSVRTWRESISGIKFVWIPGGCYIMGSNTRIDSNAMKDELPLHEVCLDGYWMGKYEVTQAEWLRVIGVNPSRTTGDTCPVDSVSWIDAQAFIKKLNDHSDNTFRLPTEAEWEYAARSGGKKERYAGGIKPAEKFAWYSGNSNRPRPVGTRAPNGFGLYDMSGNVWEWCEDWYNDNAYSAHYRNNPSYTTGGLERVRRGGSSYDSRTKSRTTNRDFSAPDTTSESTGFRLVMTQ